MAGPHDTIVVKCDVVGHSSPRWRKAKSDEQRETKNHDLSLRRARVAAAYFKESLSDKLSGLKVKFLEDVSVDETDIPDSTAIVGSTGRGSRDTLPAAGGDTSNDDAEFRRADLSVKITRATFETVVVVTKDGEKWYRSTRSRFWRMRMSWSGSLEIVVGAGMARLEIINGFGDKAEGVITSLNLGVGLDLPSFSPYDWSNEVNFTAKREIGFADFHGAVCTLTSAGLVAGIGYSSTDVQILMEALGYRTFNFSGWSTGLDASISGGVGTLILDMVPGDTTVEHMDRVDWNDISSTWITEETLPVYFKTNSDHLDGKYRDQIDFLTEQINDAVRAL